MPFGVCFSIPFSGGWGRGVVISLDNTILCGYFKLTVCLKHFLLLVRKYVSFYELYNLPWFGCITFQLSLTF